MDLTGKRAWVTGASSGIGEATAYALAKRGMSLVLTARRVERLEAVRARCPDPERVQCLPADLLDADAWSGLSEQAWAAFDGVDLMVHNAGVTQRALAEEASMEEVRRIMELNFFSVVGLTRALLPRMLARGAGHFAVVSSLAGHVGTPKRSSYSASKHALVGYFDSLRAEVHARGLRVTMICPGWIETELAKTAVTSGGVPYAGDKHAPKRMSAEDCAEDICRAIERDALEAFPGGWETLSVYLKRFAPGLVARAVRRVKTS